MPRKKKLDPNNRSDLRNYTEVLKEDFWIIYKKLGNPNGDLKIVDSGVVPRYLIFTSYFKK